MKESAWLKRSLLLTGLILCLIVSFNMFVDTYGVYLSLFSFNNNLKTDAATSAKEINGYIFNPEYIIRHPQKFDSFLFGSSLVGTMDMSPVKAGHFFNMSYSQGLPAEHLAIIKLFLQKGIKIRTVLIGLDEFSFSVDPQAHLNQLLRTMHPSASNSNRIIIFSKYFFRIPQLFELSNGLKLMMKKDIENSFKINECGMYLRWQDKENQVKMTGEPLFHYDAPEYKPCIYNKKVVNQTFYRIEELISLAKENHFNLIFFFNPIYGKKYLHQASSLFPVKERLSTLTNYYDFSGFNSVKTNDLNYYEETHYRYLVGNMIVKRIFGDGDIDVPNDFGVFVTAQNVNEHINKQKSDLENYLTNKNMSGKLL